MTCTGCVVHPPTATPPSRPLVILGATTDGEIVFTFHPDTPGLELTLGESDLIELMNALHRDYLPLYPFQPCEADGCGADSVAVVDGHRYACEGHALSFGAREEGL